MKLKLNLASVW